MLAALIDSQAAVASKFSDLPTHVLQWWKQQHFLFSVIGSSATKTLQPCKVHGRGGNFLNIVPMSQAQSTCARADAPSRTKREWGLHVGTDGFLASLPTPYVCIGSIGASMQPGVRRHLCRLLSLLGMSVFALIATDTGAADRS